MCTGHTAGMDGIFHAFCIFVCDWCKKAILVPLTLYRRKVLKTHSENRAKEIFPVHR